MTATISDVALYGTTAASTSYAVTLPTLVVDETLLMVCRVPGSSTISLPTDWSEVARGTGLALNSDMAIFTKTVVGDEGSTVSVSTSSAGGFVAVTYALAGVTSIEGLCASQSDDPPELVASSIPDLWLAAFSGRRFPDASAAPTDYSNMQSQGSNGTSTSSLDCVLHVAQKAGAGSATEDPSTFTYSGGDGYCSGTVAIIGDGGSGGGGGNPSALTLLHVG